MPSRKPRTAKQINRAISHNVESVLRIASAQRITIGFAIAQHVQANWQHAIRNEIVLRGFVLNATH